MRAGWSRLVMVAAALATPAACSQPTSSQPFSGACGPFQALSWVPTPDSQTAPRNTAVQVTLDDYPDPDTVGPVSFLLTTGRYYYTGSYAVDLLKKAVIFRPASTLRGSLGYTVSLLPQLRSLAGCPVTFAQRSFVTGEGMNTAPALAATPFASVLPILRRCGGAGCHRAPEAAPDDCLAGPAAGLSLCDAEAWDALVGVPSSEVSRLLRVDPRNAARSYLLRKLLPAVPGGGPVSGTVGHLDPPGAPLSADELRTVAGWIDSGALR